MFAGFLNLMQSIIISTLFFIYLVCLNIRYDFYFRIETPIQKFLKQLIIKLNLGEN
jgi:hypothetical protein